MKAIYQNILAVCVIMSGLYSNILWSNVVYQNPNESDYKIDQAVSVIVSQKGFDAIKDDIITILNSNGIDLNRFAMEESKYTSEILPTEKLAGNPTMQKTIKDMKTLLNKYLKGFELKPHQFNLNIKKILIQANWNSIQLNVHPFLRKQNNELQNNELFKADLILTANNIRLKADSVSLTDLENAWLGTWGLNNLMLESIKGAVPLKIKIETSFYRKPDDSIGIEILKITTNIEQTKLDISNSMTLVMPKIEIRIDDQSFEVNKAEIEKDLLQQEENILKSLQSAINQNVKDVVPALLNKYLSNMGKLNISEINQMAPPSAPTANNAVVEPLIWGIKLAKFSADNGLFALHFKGLVTDPKPIIEELNTTKKIKNKKHPLNKASNMDCLISCGELSKYHPNNDLYDLTFSFKTDFFNEFIAVSYKRSYIKDIPFGEKDKITMIQTPRLYVDELGQLKMRIRFTNVIKGLEAIAVKNPVVIELDLFIDTPIDAKTKSFTLIVKDIDMTSIQVSEDNFNFPFKKLGLKKTREIIENSRKATQGMVLSSELPIPSDLMGINLTSQASSYDANGYMLFHMNYR